MTCVQCYKCVPAWMSINAIYDQQNDCHMSRMYTDKYFLRLHMELGASSHNWIITGSLRHMA